MRQAAEDALDAALDQAIGVERLHAQIDATGEAGVRLGNREAALLPRRDGDDLDGRVAEQDVQQLQGRVAGAAEDGDLGHLQRPFPKPAWRVIEPAGSPFLPFVLHCTLSSITRPRNPRMQTIHEAAEAIRQRKLSPLDLVEQCLAYIDRWEEKVRAWVFVDRDGARAEAQRLTAELERGQYRGRLHGIPLGIKDIFDVFDWPTAAGSKLWANSIARQDADVVRQLRQAGAIFLGKTVTTQYASFDPPVTRNPWNLERTPGGSSSGSAVAVATGMCLGALGSQTGGSITRPAAYCGVAGCKPSYGLVSCNGVVPLAHSMDHPGPIGRCVKDLAILLGVLVPPNTVGGLHHQVTDYIQVIREGLKTTGPELRRFRGLFEDRAQPAVCEAMDLACAQIQENCYWLVGTDALPASFCEVIPRHRTVMAVEAADFHQERLARHPEDYQPRISQLLEEGLSCTATEYVQCKTHQLQLRGEMDRIMRTGHVYLTPATTLPAPDASSTGDPAFNSPWSYTGLPTICIPTGQFIDGLPFAIQLVAGTGRESNLFMAAAWCEKALGVGPLTPPLPW